MKLLPYILVILLMLVLSAYFSASEIAFNASNKLRLKKRAESGRKTAALALWIGEHFTGALSAILIGNNLANIAASTSATVIAMELIRQDGVASLAATVVMTLLILIFGEIVPKILAKQKADTVVEWVSYPTRILTILLYPLVALVTGLVSLLRRIWGRDSDEDTPTVTEEELSTIIETVEEEGVIDEEKSELLQSTLAFPDTTVGEILTPRIDLTVINLEDSREEIEAVIENSRYSRLPVYEDRIDNIVGILSLNHFYKAMIENEEADIRSLLIEPLFLHKSMKLPDALSKMRTEQTHIAIVIDEYGGTMGVVTMEDILEELVGDIWDENDEIVDEVVAIGDHMYDVSGDTNIEDFFEEIGFSDSEFESEYTTVGGWAVERLEANPHVGDSFTYKNLYVIVTEMEEMRVTKVSAVLTPLDTEDEAL